MGDKPALGHQGNDRTTGDPAATCLPSGTANGAATRVRSSQRRKHQAAYQPARGGKGGSASEEKTPQRSKAVAVTQRSEIIQRLNAGEFISDIARSFSVTPSALIQQLSGDPEYKAAREAGAEVRLTGHYSGIGLANDVLSLARAREGFKAASWFAEREFPERWGQKGASITINTTNVDQAVIVSASDLLETVAQKRHAAVLPLDQAGEDTVSGE